MKILCTMNEKYLIPVIKEVIKQDKIPNPETEDPLCVHIIPYEVESGGQNEETTKSSEPMYPQKATGNDTSLYEYVQLSLR